MNSERLLHSLQGGFEWRGEGRGFWRIHELEEVSKEQGDEPVFGSNCQIREAVERIGEEGKRGKRRGAVAVWCYVHMNARWNRMGRRCEAYMLPEQDSILLVLCLCSRVRKLRTDSS